MRARTLSAVVVTAVWAAAARAEETPFDLVAAARAGVRPDECGGSASARVNRWERARHPGLHRYCESLARGYAALRLVPKAALSAALEADAALPGRAPPLVLAARAETALGAWPEAWARFERARRLDPRSLEAPWTLRDVAISGLRTGHAREALTAYRSLAPRAALLGDVAAAERALVETGILAMSFGPDHLVEAVGYLTEARRTASLPGLSEYGVAGVALARARQGRAREASAIAAEASGPWRLEEDRLHAASGKGTLPIDLPVGEIDALVGVLAEERAPDLAVERWRSYLAHATTRPPAFEEYARARIAALERRGRR